jgi:hypothetical protein
MTVPHCSYILSAIGLAGDGAAPRLRLREQKKIWNAGLELKQ